MITFQSGDITDVRLGDTPIKSVCIGTTEVWAAVKPVAWVLTALDHPYAFSPSGVWTPSDPNLSAKPAPMKGCLVLSAYRGTETPDFVVNAVIFDGTRWQSSSDGNAGNYEIDARAAIDEPPFITGWWNGPTAAKDAQDNLSTLVGGLLLTPWAEPDGVHLIVQNKDDVKQTFVCPYPAGVTMADLPPTESFAVASPVPPTPAKPAGTLWLHRLDDQSYFPSTIFSTGWLNDVAPNLSKFPPPAKGSILLNCVLDAYDRTVANCIIFDGTAWTTDPLEELPTFIQDSRAAAGEYIYLHWWNMPGATDVQDFFDTADAGHLRVAVWAAADGIHYKLQNKDDASVNFSKPYPAGITAADLPPTMTDVTL